MFLQAPEPVSRLLEKTQKMLLGQIVRHPSYNQTCCTHLFYYMYTHYEIEGTEIQGTVLKFFKIRDTCNRDLCTHY